MSKNSVTVALNKKMISCLTGSAIGLLFYSTLLLRVGQKYGELTATPPTAHNSGTHSTEKNQSISFQRSFLELAWEAKTKKVLQHKYECLYKETLAPLRDKVGLKLLEIGLGCTSTQGPGTSYKLWSSYFNHSNETQVYFLEWDRACGEGWLKREKARQKSRQHIITKSGQGKLPIILYGDKLNKTMLQRIAKEFGPWDIIVDGDGDSVLEQTTSFKELWPAVNPQGWYFIENLKSSTMSTKGGSEDGLAGYDTDYETIRETTLTMLMQAFSLSISNPLQLITPVADAELVAQLTCCDQICGLKRT